MKGNAKVITLLNEFLADELTAISQYMVHSEMCASWGYKKLHEAVKKRAIDRNEACREADRAHPRPGGSTPSSVS